MPLTIYTQEGLQDMFFDYPVQVQYILDGANDYSYGIAYGFHILSMVNGAQIPLNEISYLAYYPDEGWTDWSRKLYQSDALELS